MGTRKIERKVFLKFGLKDFLIKFSLHEKFAYRVIFNSKWGNCSSMKSGFSNMALFQCIFDKMVKEKRVSKNTCPYF